MFVSWQQIKSNKVLNLLVHILGFIFLLNIIINFFLAGMIFIPYGSMGETPENWGLKYENVFLKTSENNTIHGWFIPHSNARHTLLFFHGNAGNISHRGESVKIFHRLGLNVFIIDYRGYGKSEGSPDETKLYEDAHLAWEYLTAKKRLQRENVIVFGRSMGGAIATKLAMDVQPRALILESVFSSINDMAQHSVPGISNLVFFRFNFDNASMIKQVHSPLLQLHSPDDEIIPFEQGKKVFDAASMPKKFIQLKGSHNSGFMQSQPEYERHLKEFIDIEN